MTNARNLLWVDDDAPGRFPYEAYLIKSRGWSLTWATSVPDAFEALATHRFDGLLLDQMAPYDASGKETLRPWGGCWIVRWLAGAEQPLEFPVSLAKIWQAHPIKANRTIPTMIFSGFYDEEIWRSINEVRPEIALYSKPIDPDVLTDFLEECESTVSEAP